MHQIQFTEVLALATIILTLLDGVLSSACNERNALTGIQGCLTFIKDSDLELVDLGGLTSQQWDEQCNDYKATVQCIKRTVEGCSPEISKTPLRAISDLKRTIGRICDDEGFQAQYRRHSSCYNTHGEEMGNCLHTFQTEMKEFVDRATYGNTSLKAMCQSYDKALLCVTLKIYDCGTDATNTFTEMTKILLPEPISQGCKTRDYSASAVEYRVYSSGRHILADSFVILFVLSLRTLLHL
ncbi:unnamed protein product [Owenia fusiformis]|uniref:Uncharacterized protein n=1 Tax=Owenia fusiformis TaxID=6347 RepID=A0A8S4NRD8_OWEFU|nr:unnamed protein product [Owenia fusiformis]